MQSSAIDRSHIAPVTTREELIYLLSRASELEHGLSCVYLYAAYSLKSDASEGGLTREQSDMVRRWKRRIAAVAVEEMLHLAQVANLLTAVGGAPHFRRKNFPQPASAFPIGIPLSLEPFSLDIIERLTCYEAPETGILSREQQACFDPVRARVVQRRQEMGAAQPGPGSEPFDIDFATVGEFYHKIETGFRTIPERDLFIGPRRAQANARFVDLGGKLVPVTDRKSACAAIDMIVEQGEAPPTAHPDAHFFVFDSIRMEYAAALQVAEASGIPFEPVRAVAFNPMTRLYDDASGGTLITDPLTHQVADLFNVAYDTMLIMLMRFFAHTEEREAELEHLARATLILMTAVLRPLGEALTKMPVGPGAPDLMAGPGFGYNFDIHLLPHKRSAWVFFAERLRQLATGATRLRASAATAARLEIEEAAAALQGLSEQFAPTDRTWNAAAQDDEIRALDDGQTRSIKPAPNGPLLVTNVAQLTNSKGEEIKTRPDMALCRCGGSATKPFCDGTHARIGFSSEPSPDHTPDVVADYAGSAITVHFNRLQCAASEQCSKSLAEVFREGEKPWIQPDHSIPRKIIEVIRRCPSGALRYTYRGHTGPRHGDAPSIRICRNGPYEVRGDVALNTTEWPAGASQERCTLCRCGASRNKPFCDGSHWRIKFRDDRN